jgi:hypothetical protein
MFFSVEDNLPDLPHSVLRRKALKLEKLGRWLRIIKLVTQLVCITSLSYALYYDRSHPGYCVKFIVPSAMTCK